MIVFKICFYSPMSDERSSPKVSFFVHGEKRSGRKHVGSTSERPLDVGKRLAELCKKSDLPLC